MADIADRICVTRSGATQIVDRLLAAGYVQRVPDEADRRVIYAEVTDAGRAASASSRQVFYDQAEQRLTSVLSQAQIAQLGHIVDALLSAHDAARSAGAIAPSTA